MRNRHSDLILTVVEHGLTVCECMFDLQLCSVIFIKMMSGLGVVHLAASVVHY